MTKDAGQSIRMPHLFKTAAQQSAEGHRLQKAARTEAGEMHPEHPPQHMQHTHTKPLPRRLRHDLLPHNIHCTCRAASTAPCCTLAATSKVQLKGIKMEGQADFSR